MNPSNESIAGMTALREVGPAWLDDAALLMAQRVQALQAAYVRCIDNDQLEHWPGFFEQKCLYKVISADNHARGFALGVIHADSRAMLTDRINAMRRANIFERHAYRHVIGPSVISAVHNDVVDAETSFMVMRIMRDGSSQMFATGRYLDRVRIDDGRPRSFIEKLAVCDSDRVDTLLVRPL
jgi:3-phenylpropionate/cinnamic acid dioxygenase small subunit